MRYLDITGVRSGKLTAIRYDKAKSFGLAIWECKCDCGTTHFAVAAQITGGHIISCGCSRVRHGHTVGRKRSPTFKSWESLRGRCNNPNDPSYASYGGRGITVCDRWDSFTAFLEDMGVRPAETSIDRIDVDGNYEPGNCRWASRSEQQRNSRKARKFTAHGLTLSIQEWAARLGTSPQAITNRMRKGMTAEDAVTTPIRRRARRKGN